MKKNLVFLLTIILCLFISGCGEGETNLSPVNTLEESSPPGIPQWTDSPYSIENVYGVKFYAHLRWNKVKISETNDVKDNIAGYKIIKTDTKGTILDTFFAPVRENSEIEFFTDTQSEQLVEGKEYTYRIICFDTYMNESRLSSPVTILIQPSMDKRPVRPGKPDYILESDQTKITIFWNPVTTYENNESISAGDLGGYEVYRAGPEDLTRPSIPLAVIKGDRTEYSDVISINHEQVIRYWIRAFHIDGAKSSYSDPVEITLDRIPDPSSPEEIKDAQNIPGAVHPMRIQENSIGMRTLYWSAPKTNTDGTYPALVSRYMIYQSQKKTGPYSLVGSSISTSYSFYASNSVNYYFRVTAVDVYNNEGPLSGIIHKDIILPDINFAPTEEGYINIRKGDSSSETINVIEWTLKGTVLLEASTVNIYRSYDPKGPYFNIGSRTVGANNGLSLNMSYSDSNNVISGTSYYYRITVSNSLGNESSPSHFIQIVPKQVQGLMFLFREMPITFDASNPYLDTAVSYVPDILSDGTPVEVITYEVGFSYPVGSVKKNSRTSSGNPAGYPSVPSGNYIEFRTISVIPATGLWKMRVYYRYEQGILPGNNNDYYQMTVYAEDDSLFGSETDDNADPDLNRVLLNIPLPQHDVGLSDLIQYEAPVSLSIQNTDINDNNDYLYFRIWCGPEENGSLTDVVNNIRLYAVEFSRN